MSKVEKLKMEIEIERKRLDEMLENSTMEAAMVQSRRLDSLIEEYIDLTN